MLDKVVQYLQEIYPYTGGTFYNEAVEQLTEAIAASSVTAVTRKIRETTPCPKIVLLADSQQYTFKPCAKEVFLNFEQAFVSKAGFSYGFNGFLRTEDFIDHYPVLVDDSHPKYLDEQGSERYLYEWIRGGEECEECGATYIADSGTHEHLCHTCSRAYTVLPYNAQADVILGFENTKDTLFGIELEYEGVTAFQVAKSLKGHAISKSDGTIRSGVEIVTRPACIATHKEKLQPFYDAVKVAAKSNTGMHVHVEKAKLTNYEIGFMMEFLNKTELVADIEKIAGRSYSTNSYCKTSPGMKMTWGNKFDEDGYKISKQATQKYSPFNTAKDKTVEIRIFSSPESHEEVCAKLDFVAALVKYSSPYSVSVKSLRDKFEWNTFTDFVKMNRKTYPHFCSFFLKG